MTVPPPKKTDSLTPQQSTDEKSSKTVFPQLSSARNVMDEPHNHSGLKLSATSVNQSPVLSKLTASPSKQDLGNTQKLTKPKDIDDGSIFAYMDSDNESETDHTKYSLKRKRRQSNVVVKMADKIEIPPATEEQAISDTSKSRTPLAEKEKNTGLASRLSAWFRRTFSFQSKKPKPKPKKPINLQSVRLKMASPKIDKPKKVKTGCFGFLRNIFSRKKPQASDIEQRKLLDEENTPSCPETVEFNIVATAIPLEKKVENSQTKLRHLTSQLLQKAQELQTSANCENSERKLLEEIEKIQLEIALLEQEIEILVAEYTVAKN